VWPAEPGLSTLKCKCKGYLYVCCCLPGYCQSRYTVTGGKDTENLLDGEDNRETKMKIVFKQSCDFQRATKIRKH